MALGTMLNLAIRSCMSYSCRRSCLPLCLVVVVVVVWSCWWPCTYHRRQVSASWQCWSASQHRHGNCMAICHRIGECKGSLRWHDHHLLTFLVVSPVQVWRLAAVWVAQHPGLHPAPAQAGPAPTRSHRRCVSAPASLFAELTL